MGYSTFKCTLDCICATILTLESTPREGATPLHFSSLALWVEPHFGCQSHHQYFLRPYCVQRHR